MQRALSKAGIVFEPEVWPTADTRIRLRKDASVAERDGSESVLAGLLPQWLEPFVLPSGSRDPLGLQAPAERLVNEVLPGLTVFTFRAGYYGFLAWAIRHVNGLAPAALPRGRRRTDSQRSAAGTSSSRPPAGSTTGEDAAEASAARRQAPVASIGPAARSTPRIDRPSARDGPSSKLDGPRVRQAPRV